MYLGFLITIQIKQEETLMKLEQIDIELQTIITINSLGGGVHVVAAMVCDALEDDGYVLDVLDRARIFDHVGNVRAAALEVMWK